METILRRLILAVCIGILSFGFSHIIPHGLAYGEVKERELKAGYEDTEDDSGNTDEERSTQKVSQPEQLSVHLTIDTSKVNPLVRERYNIYAKVDPQNPKSKKFHFKLGKGDQSEGKVDFTGVKEGKKLQLFVVKDNYQRDCIPVDAGLKKKVDKNSTIDGMPTSVSIKLVQSEQHLNESDLKKFSGHGAVPECVITAMEFGKR
jgi:hypothetical protein